MLYDKLRKQQKNRRQYLKNTRADSDVISSKDDIILPSWYKSLTLSEFMIVTALKECVEIPSQESLAKNTCLSIRTITSSVKNLELLGYLKKVKCGKNIKLVKGELLK
jgi:DNA-binding MarR family transcriptional regulator